MDLNKIYQRYQEIKKLYAEADLKRLGYEWPRGEMVKAFVADVGALVKLTMGKDGFRDIENVDEKLKHELADCLYSVFLIAEKYDVDLEPAFMETMDELESRAKKDELPKSHSL
jgi:NTP pyrophosphatase (non-canonical NTP hydrolase)